MVISTYSVVPNTRYTKIFTSKTMLLRSHLQSPALPLLALSPRKPWYTTQSHTPTSSGTQKIHPTAKMQNGKQDIPGRKWEYRRGSDSLVSLFQLWRQKPRWWFFSVLTLFSLYSHLLKSHRKGPTPSPTEMSLSFYVPTLAEKLVNSLHMSLDRDKKA